MRKSREEAALTRQRIIEAASAEFRRNGIGNTGLADLMAAAGLTHGGFYKHFESKEQVVAQSCRLAAESLADKLEGAMAKAAGGKRMEAAIDAYLSVDHRDHASEGCPFAALGSELARSGDVVREQAMEGLMKIVNVLASAVDDATPATARKRAWMTLSMMVGALVMARVVPDPESSLTILRQARKQLVQ